ncbi:polyhomeotic-like protein 2 [Diorhabda sublineata]|uniref:polyhomeotic-like protein 2 n=1 Tax=Diorhabda sublineata TaxID=1163346 RepID=UPI0024E0948C|nr:polyhomeotic-like protein 2 [Diorhabda sublineata]
MSTINRRDNVLEAIDQMRRRKARPDSERICKYLNRRFYVNVQEAKNDLDWCVANKYVFKVEYKGRISYRIAAKKNAQQRYVDGKGTDNMLDKNYKTNFQFIELLTNAFGELIMRNPDYLKTGIPRIEIINIILAKDKVRYTKKYICLLLEKEVERGELIKTENGNYLMQPSCRKNLRNFKLDEIENVKEVSNEQCQLNKNYDNHEFIKETNKYSERKYNNDHQYKNMDSPNKSVDNGKFSMRNGLKRSKRVFDRSDDHVPKKRGRPIGSLKRSTLEHQLARQKSKDSPEILHESKTSTCNREKHDVCHKKNKKGSNGGFIACKECNIRDKNATPTSNFGIPSLSFSPSRLSPQTERWTRNFKSKKDIDKNDIDASIPDATYWTADEVYDYFAQYFPEEAKIFKEQEIDGRSLLLLKRIDVLTNLNLKLRPALKIYKHVVKLQLRRADYKLYWW